MLLSLANVLAVFGVGCDGEPVGAPAVGCQAEANVLCGRPLNLAHRGGGNLRPENTLEAFRNAVSVGADVLELDVQRTADDVIVVIHDATVDRTTDGTGAVGDLLFAELEQLDAGYWFTTDGGATYPYRGMAIRIPTLEQVLAAHPSMHFSIEIKDTAPTVTPVLAMISAHGLADQVVIASFYDRVLGEVRDQAPAMLTTMSLGEMVEFAQLTETTELTYAPPAAIIQAPVDELTDGVIARAHRMNLVVQAWTVDDVARMSDLLARGVDGIITNLPDQLAAVISAPSTPPRVRSMRRRRRRCQTPRRSTRR